MLNSFIVLKGIKTRAFHGTNSQERLVGNDFSVDLRVGYNVEKAFLSDNTVDTLDYSALIEIIKQEMCIPSNLIEHVGWRIIVAIKNNFCDVKSIDLIIKKHNPPIRMECSEAGIELHWEKD